MTERLTTGRKESLSERTVVGRGVVSRSRLARSLDAIKRRCAAKQMTAEDADRIAAVIPMERGSGDKRRFPRRESAAIVSVCRLADSLAQVGPDTQWGLHSTPLKGGLENISMNGIAFRLRAIVQPGEHLVLRVTNRVLGSCLDVTATVVRSVRDDDGEWKVICRFRNQLTFEQLAKVSRPLRASQIV